MAYKPQEDNSESLMRLPEAVFSLEQFINDVFNDKYILVVGSEVVLDKQVHPSGDVNQYILSVINAQLSRNYGDYNDLFSRIGSDIDPIRNLLTSNSFVYDIEDISPELRAVMQTRLFRFVLTTTIDGYVERLMEEVWGPGGFRIVNIGDKTSVDGLRNALNSCRDGIRYQEPTLFYIFGRALPDETKKYVRCDDDAIQIIDKWIQLPKEDPMVRYIRNKKLLALGCKFEDWYFRFFWYNLKRDISRFREGQVAFMLNDDVMDRRLDTFLQRSMIYRHSDARAFMSDITRALVSTDREAPVYQMVVKSRRAGGIFISYCSLDFVTATRLFFALRQEGLDVWFDNQSLKGGDDYNREIRDAVGQARVFLSLLTPHVANDLREGSIGHYYNDEWRMAAQLPDKAIIPIAADGYDLRADYHTDGFEPLFGKTLHGLDLMTPDGFQQLVRDLNQLLA